ncbi:hypothetical protein ABZ614_29625 [Streptomyces sp. NPDC013178]|uniref:hypothetical protein n=1 Tax=unclassified Streptomyces TaxID=2593676 RepID=UPI0033CB6C43
MPRNRPGALRAHPPLAPRPRSTPPPPRIPGLSARTSLAIHRVEHDRHGHHLFPGATESALRRYRDFLSHPGHRTLYPRASVCPACPGCGLDDVRTARDALAETLSHLPPPARTELTRALRPLDHRYRLRTLPDPRADGTEPWWHRRLAEGAEGW